MYAFLAAALLALTVPLFSHGSEVEISVKGSERVVKSNGLPDHATGDFPNRHNPNEIKEQKYEFHMPLNPGFSGHINWTRMQNWGVALNGVVFDPGTNEFWHNDRESGWRYEALGGSMDLGLDDSHAHVQPDGSYHYHGIPKGLLKGKKGMTMVGYAADGFPVYSQYAYKDPKDANTPLLKMAPGYRLKSGERSGGPGGSYDGKFTADFEYVSSLGDLDECNGREGVTPEYPKGTYYYVLTDTFPYVPRCWKGEPDDSFRKKLPTGGRRPPPRPGKDGGPEGGPNGPSEGRKKPVDPYEVF